MNKLEKVIIWGHQLHSHTHSYIHYGFYKAFQHMGYKVYWFDDTLENLNICNNKYNLDNTLFIGHGLVCKYLPLNINSLYILHNTQMTEYKSDDNKIMLFPKDYYIHSTSGIPKDNIITLQVYTSDCINRDIPDTNNKYHYYLKPPHQCIYFPWATDLLPHEIQDNIDNLKSIISNSNEKCVNFVGMSTDKWSKVKEYCTRNNIKYSNYGGTFNIDSKFNVSPQHNISLIQKSIIAPSIQTDWQVEHKYIPCRIFKNISYGKMGMTNSEAVHYLFDNKLLYNTNINKLLNMGLQFENTHTIDEKYNIIKELMICVRDKHTYINRCNYMLDYIKKYYNLSLCK